MGFQKCRACGKKNRRSADIVDDLCVWHRDTEHGYVVDDAKSCYVRFHSWLYKNRRSVHREAITSDGPYGGQKINWDYAPLLVAFDEWLEGKQ